MKVCLNELGNVIILPTGSTASIYGTSPIAAMGTAGILTCYGDAGTPLFQGRIPDTLWKEIQEAEVSAHELRANRCESAGNLAGFKTYSQVAIYIASLTLDEYKRSVIIQ